MHSIKNTILSIIRTHHSFQRVDGSFPAGHNGPYKDRETTARTTSHWLIANLYAWRATNCDLYIDVASKAFNYLRNLVYLDDMPITCRISQKKDRYNGLMGQAWILEALAEYAQHTQFDTDYECAHHMYSKFSFCGYHKTWYINESSNTSPTFDRVFNHNLWFCAAAGLLADRFIDVHKCVDSFVSNISSQICLYPDNIIHHSPPLYLSSLKKDSLKICVRYLYNRFFARRLYLKSVGYHSFNLYALALLYSRNNSSWCDKLKFLQTLYSVTKSKKFRQNVISNKYSFDYNAPGFELPFVEVILNSLDKQSDISYWLYSQFSYTLRSLADYQLHSQSDSTTLNARIYELSRILPLIQDV